MPTKAFNPMAYAARQEKRTWTPAMQAKEDAATTLQLAVKGMRARRTTQEMKNWKEHEIEARLLIMKHRSSADIYKAELKSLPKSSPLREGLKNLMEYQSSRADLLEDSLKRKEIVDLSQFGSDISWGSFSGYESYPESLGNFGRDFYAEEKEMKRRMGK